MKQDVSKLKLLCNANKTQDVQTTSTSWI